MTTYSEREIRCQWLRLAGICALILGAGNARALDPAKTVFQYNCRTWTRQNGLPVNGITAITQTRDGYLWLGTPKGLVRFDGNEFKLVSLPNRPDLPGQGASCLVRGKAGGLWFGITSGAYGFFDGQSFLSRQREGWEDARMNVLAVWPANDGAVWVGSDKGAARSIPGHTNATRFFEEPANCSMFYEDAHGRVWVGTANRGLFYWEAGQLHRFPDEALTNNIVMAVVEDQRGQIWVGTENGLRAYDARFKPRESTPWYSEVRSLLVDRHGELWLGTTGEGLVRYQNGQYASLRKADGLANNSVTALYEDREGSIWVGTKEGLSQVSDIRLPIFSATEGLLEGACHGVGVSRRGGVWAASDHGLSYFDGKMAKNFTTEAGLSSPYIKRVYEARNGDVYLIDAVKNVEVLSGEKIVARYQSHNLPVGMVEDGQGMVVSVAGDLFRIEAGQFLPFPYRNNVVPPMYWILNLWGARDGSIWVASVNGIFRIREGGFEQWSLEDGLSSLRVNWVCEDNEGVIWAGLTTGIARIKNGRARMISRANGLFDDFIYAIVPDDLGYLWVNSERGIFQVSRRAMNELAEGKRTEVECKGYDGLESVKTIDTTKVESAGCKTRDGRIWFPSPQGVVMIEPSNLVLNATAPQVHLQRVRVNGTEWAGDTPPKVQPGAGELEFHYTGLSFIAPQKVQFRYQLEGYDATWIDAGARRSALYTNLKPGKYRFRVQACSVDGVWGAAGDSVELELPPHYYERAWFRAACGLAVGLVAFGVYGWRVRHLENRERRLRATNELLETKVSERTGELAGANQALRKEIEAHHEAQVRLETLHKQLVSASRQAGMAEVAVGVLHNVGNVLNSVNVSATLLAEKIRHSRANQVGRVAGLLRENQADLTGFFAAGAKGAHLITFLETLNEHLSAERSQQLVELNTLCKNVDHIKEIVAMQQAYAQVSGLVESVNVVDLVEDSLRIHAAAYSRHSVMVTREFEAVAPVKIERHKALQILVNLLHNAKYACDANAPGNRKVTVRILGRPEMVGIQVADNGVGIPAENLTRIFTHGFTTRRNGHGFGLHSGALAAKEMGGTLRAESAGPGQGATFTLELPQRASEALDPGLGAHLGVIMAGGEI